MREYNGELRSVHSSDSRQQCKLGQTLQHIPPCEHNSDNEGSHPLSSMQKAFSIRTKTYREILQTYPSLRPALPKTIKNRTAAE